MVVWKRYNDNSFLTCCFYTLFHFKREIHNKLIVAFRGDQQVMGEDV